MRRIVFTTGAGLIAFGLGVFLWKVLVLGMPMMPEESEGLWRVELEVSARGDGRRGSLAVPLPSSGPGQVIFDESTASDRLVFTIRDEKGQRVGIWSGRFDGVQVLVQGFRVQLQEVQTPVPAQAAGGDTPERLLERHGGPTPELPVGATMVEEFLASRSLPPRNDPAVLLRSLFAFVSDEIGTTDTGADDALLTLAAREGTAKGRTRLLATLLRSVDIPSRMVLGLQLPKDQPPREIVWIEAWVDGTWIPLSPAEGLLGTRPADRVALRVGSDQPLEATGVEAVGRRYNALRERLRPEELATMMVPPNRVLRWLSLYRLPVTTQEALRVLLLLPLGALVVAVFRNLIGVPTFGTFMPVLLALALRVTSLLPGLGLVGLVLGIGIFGRLVLERLRLLLVPRLAVLLCVVVLVVTGVALVGHGAAIRYFFVGVLFPMVILTMLIERFSVTTAEEGLREALIRTGYSTLVAVAVYPVLRSETAQFLMFGFPELVFVVMGVLVWIGGYTGFRLLDLVRFRTFAEPEPDTGA